MPSQERKITLSFSDRKLSALEYFMEQKDLLVETELDDFLQKLYEKHVPVQTKSYLDHLESAEKPEKKPASKDAAKSIPATQSGETYP